MTKQRLHTTNFDKKLQEKQLSSKQLSDMLNVTTRMVDYWREGKFCPNGTNLEKIQDIFDGIKIKDFKQCEEKGV